MANNTMAEEKKTESGDEKTADSPIDLAKTEDLHKWLITKGVTCVGVKPFLTAYFHKLRQMGIPVNMIFGGGVLLSEYTPGYIWTCEDNDDNKAFCNFG